METTSSEVSVREEAKYDLVLVDKVILPSAYEQMIAGGSKISGEFNEKLFQKVVIFTFKDRKSGKIKQMRRKLFSER